jgi:hypothetical protein
LIEAKKEKIFEVVVPNTIAYPGTMVVHFGNTNATNTAMVGSFWFPVAASGAEISIARLLLRNDNRFEEGCFEVADES